MNISDQRLNLGKKGEAAALVFLNSQGWKIVAQNFRLKRYEIDIIACKKNQYCLFEVKTRNGRIMTNIVSERQKAHLRLAHQAFCESKCLPLNSVSFALIIIYTHNNRANLEYYPHFL